MERITAISFVFITTVIISRLIIPFLMNRSHRLGLIDRPGNRKVHARETPVIGGLGLMLSLVITSLIFEPIRQLAIRHIYWFISVLLIFFMALADDRFQLTAKIRLLIQLIAAALVTVSGIRIESMFGLFGIHDLPLLMQYTLTIIVIVGITNAFNLIDGIDGLAGSFALVNFLVLGILAIILEQELVMFFCFAITGGLFSFLHFNFYPARIFMGDAGSMSLGFILATLSMLLLQSKGNAFSLSPFIIVASILIVPVTDALRVFLRRYVNGLSVFNADKTHLHHLLLEQGRNHAQATGYLLCFHLIMITGGILLSFNLSVTSSLMLMIGWQLVLSKLFALDKTVKDWRKIINQQEIS